MIFFGSSLHNTIIIIFSHVNSPILQFFPVSFQPNPYDFTRVLSNFTQVHPARLDSISQSVRPSPTGPDWPVRMRSPDRPVSGRSVFGWRLGTIIAATFLIRSQHCGQLLFCFFCFTVELSSAPAVLAVPTYIRCRAYRQSFHTTL